MTETTTRESPFHAVRRLYQALGYNSTAITGALFEEFGLSDAAREFFGLWVRDRVGHELAEIDHEINRPPRSRSASDSRSRNGRRVVSQRRSHTSSGSHSAADLWFLNIRVAGTIDRTTGEPKLFRHCTAPELAERERVFKGQEAAAGQSGRSYAWAQAMLIEHKVRTFDDLDDEVILAELPEEGVRF